MELLQRLKPGKSRGQSHVKEADDGEQLLSPVFQWEKALSVAPGVSMKYWKKLMQR